jgi:hypothetical protein
MANRLVVSAVLMPMALAWPPAHAAPAWRHGPDGAGGFEVYFGEADEDERIPLIAACDKPGMPIQIWYLIERGRLLHQSVNERGLRQTIENLTVTLVIDGKRFSFHDARAEPEVTYDGNEIVLLLDAHDPLFPALANGSRLSLEIEGSVSDTLSLTGSFEPIARLINFCRGRRP